MESRGGLRTVLLLAGLLLGAAGAVTAAECPQCEVHRQWLADNADRCAYQGNRLPSICASDPECGRILAECAEHRAALDACLQECSRPPAVPPAASGACSNCEVFDQWFADNGGSCSYQGNRLGSICAADPTCLAWVEACREAERRRRDCRADCTEGPAPIVASGTADSCRVEPAPVATATPGARLPIFPTVACADCRQAFDVASRLIDARDDEVAIYQDVARLRDEVIRSRVYTLTIHSEHGQPLNAKLETRDEDLALFQELKGTLTKAAEVLTIEIPLVSYAVSRASEILDLMLSHPNETLPVAEAVAKLQRLHEERERLIDDLDGFRRILYCEQVLPHELTLSSIYFQALTDEACAEPHLAGSLRNELERVGMIHWQTLPGESPLAGSRTGGQHPQFYTWERLLYRAAACEDAGLPVHPAPIPEGP